MAAQGCALAPRNRRLSATLSAQPRLTYGVLSELPLARQSDRLLAPGHRISDRRARLASGLVAGFVAVLLRRAELASLSVIHHSVRRRP